MGIVCAFMDLCCYTYLLHINLLNNNHTVPIDLLNNRHGIGNRDLKIEYHEHIKKSSTINRTFRKRS